MKFKSLKVVLMACSLFAANLSLSEEMPESPRQKEVRIENALNMMFMEAIKAAMVELDNDQKVAPYAFVIRSNNGRMGFFTSTDKNSDMSVVEQSQRIRRMLKDMADTGQIDASVQAMYAVITQDEVKSKGIIFEIEHREGVSITRFLPMEEVKDENGKATGKWLLNTDKLKTSVKPKAVFAGK